MSTLRYQTVWVLQVVTSVSTHFHNKATLCAWEAEQEVCKFRDSLGYLVRQYLRKVFLFVHLFVCFDPSLLLQSVIQWHP